MTVAAITQPAGEAGREITAAPDPVQEEGPPPEPLGDIVVPWAISATFHIGLALLFSFIFFAAKANSEQAQQKIIVPQSFEDPSYSEHPGGNANPGATDPMQMAAQDRLKALLKTEGWTDTKSTTDLSKLVGNNGENQAMAILPGAGANLGKGKEGNGESGAAALYGPSAGTGVGPRSSFYGTGGNATKIVYLIDHTGSLLDTFGANLSDAGSIKGEVSRSVSALVPVQYFSVVVFTAPSDGGVQVLAPLTRAVPENKRSILQKFDEIVPKGGDSDTEKIFLDSFRSAFELRPELIYFLTDGDISNTVPEAVRKMNPGGAVKINVIMETPNLISALTPEDERRFAILSDLAKTNGGTGKVISYSSSR